MTEKYVKPITHNRFIYVLYLRGQIELVSYEMKVCYEDMKLKMSPFELSNLKSYSQITRDFKNDKDFVYNNTNQFYLKIERILLITSFREYLKLNKL